MDAPARRGRVAEYEIDVKRFEDVDHEVRTGAPRKSPPRRGHTLRCVFGLRGRSRRPPCYRPRGFDGGCGVFLLGHRYRGRGPGHSDAGEEFAPAHFGVGVLACHDLPLSCKVGADYHAFMTFNAKHAAGITL